MVRCRNSLIYVHKLVWVHLTKCTWYNNDNVNAIRLVDDCFLGSRQEDRLINTNIRGHPSHFIIIFHHYIPSSHANTSWLPT